MEVHDSKLLWPAIYAAVSTILICTILYRHYRWHQDRHNKRKLPVKTMIVLGSGGHTREAISLTQSLNPAIFTPRVYVSAITDPLSKVKACAMEKERNAKDFRCSTIFRAREVGQSWFTTVFTTILSFIQCVYIVLRFQPDLLVCNGPGVCVPLCAAAFAAKLLGIIQIKIIYVESVCRLQHLSLTGKILRSFVDEFIVQWRHMAVEYPFAKYIGRIS